jgi:hypothetical protein
MYVCVWVCVCECVYVCMHAAMQETGHERLIRVANLRTVAARNLRR